MLVNPPFGLTRDGSHAIMHKAQKGGPDAKARVTKQQEKI